MKQWYTLGWPIIGSPWKKSGNSYFIWLTLSIVKLCTVFTSVSWPWKHFVLQVGNEERVNEWVLMIVPKVCWNPQAYKIRDCYFVAFLRRLYYSVTHHQWCPFGLLWGRYAYWDPITLVVQYLVCSEPHWTTTSCPVSLTRQLVFHRARQLKCKAQIRGIRT